MDALRARPDRTPLADDRKRARRQAYGLAIASEIDLPQLDESAALPADIIIRRRPVAGPMPQPGQPGITSFEGDRIYFAWAGVGRFLVRDLAEVDVDTDAEFSDMFLSIALLGPVLAAILHGRGSLLLHGSATIIDGRAYLLLGDKGAGKSTLAAALYREGFPFLTDDVIAIVADGATPCVAPAFPAIKLSEDVFKALHPLPGRRLAVDSTRSAKSWLRAETVASERPVPVGGIYLIDRADGRCRIAPLDHVAALKALLRYSYMFKFGAQAFAGNVGARHFAQCAALADRIPVGRLIVPTGLSALVATVPGLLDEISKSAAGVR